MLRLRRMWKHERLQLIKLTSVTAAAEESSLRSHAVFDTKVAWCDDVAGDAAVNWASGTQLE